MVSFYALPEDASLSNVLSSLDGAITGIIGQGVAASPNPVLGWVGSLSSINSLSGYWIKVDQSAVLSIEDAIPTDPANALYNLQFGANLISFPSQNPVGVGDAIPDDVEDKFLGVIGQGVAASPNPILGWVGSLSQFEGGKGYWAKVDEAISFYFNTESSNLRTNPDAQFKPFVQSTEQAFYFIENINLEGLGTLEVGNVINAYNDNILVGQREWNGSIIDIPAMGNDGSLHTAGYCEQGDEIRLTVTLSDGNEYELNGEIPNWNNNEIFTVTNLSVSGSKVLPSNISIIGAYPNPFNPVTNIMYNLNTSTNIDVSVYNTSGQVVANLFNGMQDAGQHNFEFSGNNLSSGMYLVKISSENDIQTQKVLLMK